jgi:ClpP class serine protease
MNLLFWSKKKIPVVALRGIIAARPGALSLEAYSAPLERGFGLAKRSGHLILAIESPGGSAAQSDLLGQFIRRKAAETGVTVIAVIGDVGASGGYWLACAADRIYANRLSIVGSIGVITGGFGFDRLIARWEIQRRLYTAGENKARGESFSPERPQDVEFTQKLLAECHEIFKGWVRERRGAKLTDEAAVFDGGYMTGERARGLGLIDGFSDVDALVKEFGGKDAKAAWLRPKSTRSLLRLVTGAAVEAGLDGVEARFWSGPRLR